MKLKITSAKIIGTPTASGWVQSHDYNPQEEEKLNLRGHLLAVIVLKNLPIGTNGVIIGREIITRLQEEYYGNLEKTPYETLKDAVEKIITEFSQTEGLEINLGVTSYLKEVSFTAVGGEMQLVLWREGALARILNGVKGKVVAASGYPKAKDVLLLGTNSFFQFFPEKMIKETLSSSTPENLNEVFLSHLHSISDTSNLGAIILSFVDSEESLVNEAMGKLPKEEGVETKTKKFRFGFGQNLFSKLRGVVRKLLPPKRLYVKNEVDEVMYTKSRKSALSVGIILLVILLTSIIFGIKQSKVKKTKALYSEKLVLAQKRFDEASSLMGVDQDKARSLFLEAKTILTEIEALKVKASDVEAFKKVLEEKQGQILGEYKLSPKLFMDLSLLSSGFSVESLSTSEGVMALLDTKGKKLVSIDIATKRAEVVAGPEELREVSKAAIYSKRFFVLKSDGIYEVASELKKVVEKVWEGDILMAAYGGNLYLVEKDTSIIDRFPGIESAFGGKQAWLAPGIKLDLGESKKITIDGSVWLLVDGKKIWKLTQGSPEIMEDFSVYPPFEEITSIYTNEETQSVYLLEQKSSRIILFDKKGKYQAQYILDGINDARDLVISEKEKIGVILNGGDKLYSFELKHLE